MIEVSFCHRDRTYFISRVIWVIMTLEFVRDSSQPKGSFFVNIVKKSECGVTLMGCQNHWDWNLLHKYKLQLIKSCKQGLVPSEKHNLQIIRSVYS